MSIVCRSGAGHSRWLTPILCGMPLLVLVSVQLSVSQAVDTIEVSCTLIKVLRLL